MQIRDDLLSVRKYNESNGYIHIDMCSWWYNVGTLFTIAKLVNIAPIPFWFVALITETLCIYIYIMSFINQL